MKGLFITGTDTDAGKTTVTAALLRALKVAGVPAAAVKPVQTGCVMRVNLILTSKKIKVKQNKKCGI